jgi:tetratricopeptide (TPR) repeat protein
MLLLKSLFLLILLNLFLLSQTKGPDIKKRLELIRNGKVSEVKKELPKLKKDYPNDAGVQYLQGVLTENGNESVKIYSYITTKFPGSEWAQKALYKLYQYYVLTGNTEKAKEKYSQLIKLDPDFQEESLEKVKFYTIQLGAFNSNEKAKNFSDQLKKLNYKPEIKTRKIDDKLFYIVHTGKFIKKADAEKAQKSIEDKLDMASIIISR